MPLNCIHCQRETEAAFKACPYCGEPITEFVRQYGDQLIDGKYKLISRLGMGGMGEVYKVLHVHLNTIRVIKVLRTATVSGPNSHERFIREAQLATRIHHPNVAALHDFATLPDGSNYMVWEFIEGTDLTQVIHKKGALAPRYAARLGREALLGLEAIHRAGIIHRDVSPDNIMIAADDWGEEHVKIIDLGIAKDGGEHQGMQTQTGVFIGKWKYCSPEHLGMLPEGERIDARADLYSFGIVLYEMLTGTAPFVSATPQEYFRRHASDEPPPMREINPTVNVPASLERVIARALAKKREKRYGSAGEFAAELERLIPSLEDTPPNMEQTFRLRHVSIDLQTPPADLHPVRPSTQPESEPATILFGVQSSKHKTDPEGTPADPSTFTGKLPAAIPRRAMTTPVFVTLMSLAIVLAASIGGLVMYNFSHFFERRNLEVKRPAPAVRAELSARSEPAPQPKPEEQPASSPAEIPLTSSPKEKRVELSAPKVSAESVITAGDAGTEATALPEPLPLPTPVAQEPAKPEQPGGLRGLFGKFRKAKTPPAPVQGTAQIHAPAPAASPAPLPPADSKPVIGDYTKLRRGQSVEWVFVAPKVDLSKFNIQISKFDDRSTLRSPKVQSTLEAGLIASFRGRESSAKTLTTRNAIYWARSGAKDEGLGIEMIFLDSTGSVVAMLRHSVKGSPPEEAARRAASSVAEFTRTNN